MAYVIVGVLEGLCAVVGLVVVPVAYYRQNNRTRRSDKR